MSWVSDRLGAIVRAAAALLAENLNAIAFMLGFSTLYVGISALSRPVANIAAGAIVMAASVWPYLRRVRAAREKN